LVGAEPSDSGFTVIEVLVALTVLAMSTAVLLAVFSQGLDRARSNSVRIEARNLAQSLLAKAEVTPPQALANSAGLSNGLSWEVRLSDYGSVEDRESWQFTPITLTSTVRWLDHGRTQSMSLSTLRLMRKKSDS
jgi:general secretion pathway protein I